MIEGIVFDVGKNHATVFTKSGEFIKLKKSGPINIGEIYKGKPYNSIFKYYAAAAIILFVLTGFTGYNAYAHQIVGYVDIAMGEGIRLYVDRAGRVQRISGINEKSLKNISIYDAIKKLENEGNKNKINGNIDIKAVKIKKSSFDSNKIEEHAKQIFNQKDTNKKDTPANKKDTPANEKVTPASEKETTANGKDSSANKIETSSDKENQNNSQNNNTLENKDNEKPSSKDNNKGNGYTHGKQK